MAKTVVIGCLGPTLDRSDPSHRWQKWRPSVALCQQEDLVIHRYHLLTPKNHPSLNTQIASDIQVVSPETELILHPYHLNDPWDFQEVYAHFYDLSQELQLNPRDHNLIHITTGSHVMQICLFLLTESRHFPAKLLQTGPSTTRSHQPQGQYQIIDLNLAKYDPLATRFNQSKISDISFLKSGIATKNTAFNQLIERIEEVVLHSSDPLLLMGPTGAGKSHLARRIYDLTTQRRAMTGEFVEVNCATLQGQAAMSTLFGHKKGSYTGATQDRAGLLRAAHHGILFLDEIGELGLDEQAMLLRAVEEKVFYPLGSDTPVKSQFQLICGTNKDLRLAVKTRAFREDLLARIDLWTFTLPGLSQRLEDIEPNLHYELAQYSQRTGKQIRFNREALQDYLRFAQNPAALWTGNFRDLNASLIRMATLSPQGRITQSVVQDEIQRLQQRWNSTSETPTSPHAATLQTFPQLQQHDLFDQLQLQAILPICQSSKSLADAGRHLFAISRTHRASTNDSDRLRKFLARFNLTWNDLRPPRP